MSRFLLCHDQMRYKEKTRILHQHLGLGEELPGLLDKGMKKFAFDKMRIMRNV